ncbi:TetR/AcrR family transcriptional regulator [Nocardia cyriacigeorgica]|uniref:TetR/AcrR family transcriptional regulator n=1 Tax=Nocardia cyriacigeorgica TaxID=135487 RepID=A0A6P1CSA9_9NOCA|nr:TetR/AcrR family transcriptional regulator [Nocardia cyriacigeorgica]
MVTSRKIDPIEMRRRLTEATVQCLVEFGYAGTTTLRVQDRAGVSRGALLHHFPSKADMFVAAVQRVAEQQARDIRAALAQGDPTEDRVRFAISVLRSAMSGPLYLAGYELWMAARTDDNLREVLAPYERQVGKELRILGAEAFGPELASQPGFSVAFEALIELLRGQALTSILRADPAREDRVLAAWTAAFPLLCAAPQDAPAPGSEG